MDRLIEDDGLFRATVSQVGADPYTGGAFGGGRGRGRDHTRYVGRRVFRRSHRVAVECEREAAPRQWPTRGYGGGGPGVVGERQTAPGWRPTRGRIH